MRASLISPIPSSATIWLSFGEFAVPRLAL